MISLRRPAPGAIAGYREARIGAVPTAIPADDQPPGLRHERFVRRVGTSDREFGRARDGLQRWVAHRDSGVEVYPEDVGLEVGATVAILTRQLGIWVLAACRVSSVVDEADEFGFTYVTLPDHPECGYESFIIRRGATGVEFEIEAFSKPGIPLVRLGRPVTEALQRRAVDRYLSALHRWTAASGG